MKKIFSYSNALDEKQTHYCPGCGHGVIHRVVAEVIEDLDIREKTVGIAPVGCSVLALEYFNCDMFGASHGRAPAVATGAKRARPDLIVFAYQGDGDLASIGTAEIVHAANRGEKFTVIFVNNAIYGMTGGQMSPTTIPNQQTTTCKGGRDVDEVGYPIQMSELLAALSTPAFIARVSVHTPEHTIEAKKVIKQAFEYQVKNQCFSFVEILSTCPTNWGLTTLKSEEWLESEMMKYYKLGIIKDPNNTKGGANE